MCEWVDEKKKKKKKKTKPWMHISKNEHSVSRGKDWLLPCTDTCTNHILLVMCLEQNPLTHTENCQYPHPACTAAPMLETLEHNTGMPTTQNSFPEKRLL
jgi:hypothetical protein